MWILILLVLLLIVGASWYKFEHEPLKRVAHAGGGYNSETYTDSIDALNFNKEKYDLFEIDLIFTSDEKVVCIHDWEHYFKRTFKIDPIKVPTYAEFNDLVKNNSRYKNCNFDTLSAWLLANKNKKLVTDVKDRNYDVLKVWADNYPYAKSQIIPQIYSPHEYQKVKELGYEKIILTLYLYGVSDEQLLTEIKDQKYYAITIHHKRALTLAPKLKKMGFNIYAHTVNDKQLFETLQKADVDEIYTDWFDK